VAPATTELIGPERIAWLRELPAEYRIGGMALLHASPSSLWKAPMPESDTQTLTTTYRPLFSRTVVYGHIHRPYARTLPQMTVANSGSVGLPYDGDPRAAYLLIDDDEVQVRRVEYDINAEIRSLLRSAYPHANWFASMLRAGRYVAPPEPE
jgi:diadenosine tetraphosphatase ApaH/serine/threonine PP2A family protein phosphatase